MQALLLWVPHAFSRPHLAAATSRMDGTNASLYSAWTDPELRWLAKPSKPPDRLAHGLIRADGKAIAGTLKDALMPSIAAFLQTTPQYAYLPGRDICDAIARVRQRLSQLKLLGFDAGAACGCVSRVSPWPITPNKRQEHLFQQGI